MKKLLIAILILTGIAAAQAPYPPARWSRVGGVFVAWNYGLWQVNVSKGTTATGVQTISVSTPTIDLGDGRMIMPFATNAPLKVGTEIVTPTAVNNCRLQDVRPGICQITANFTQIHSNAETVTSGTFGLQEALNDAGIAGGGSVNVDSAWANAGGTSGMISAAILPTSVTIQDCRTGCPTGGGGGSPGGSPTNVQYNNTTFAGDPTFTFNSTTKQLAANLFTSPLQGYQNRQDIIDVIADAGAQGAGNNSSCSYNNATPIYTGCHDDFTALNTLFTNAATQKHKVFLKGTATSNFFCDYYSSQPLVIQPNVDVQGIVANHFGNTVSICFASGQKGITLGQNSHLSGVTLYGGDPFRNTDITTYVPPASLGGAGPNAYGLIVSGQDVVENVNVYGFAGDCITINSQITGGSDGVDIHNVFAEQCRGNGISSVGTDGQVGVRTNLFSRLNQFYGIKDTSQYGNVYVSGNTSNNHDPVISVGSWTALSGTVSSIVCVASTTNQTGVSCTATMSASNAMNFHAYTFNPNDLSANDEITFAGTADAGLNGHGFYITGQTGTTFTFNYTTVESLGAGGTSSYNPGQRVWSALSTNNGMGGGWGIFSGGSGPSILLNPYSESTDIWNEFTNTSAQASIVIGGGGILGPAQGGIASGMIQMSQNQLSVFLPEIMYIYDQQNPQLSVRFGGYAESNDGNSLWTAFNNDNNLGTNNYSKNVMRRYPYGNVTGWWGIGGGGINTNATMNKVGMAFCDVLTTTGRSNIDATGNCAWAPQGLGLGNNIGGSQPDIFIDTGTAAPTTGTWKKGDLVLNTAFSATIGTVWAWSCTTAGTPGTWTGLVFGGAAITALTGDVTASGPGSVAATVAAIQGVVISGAASNGQALIASGPTAASWQTLGTGGTVTTSGSPTTGFEPQFTGSTVIGNSPCDHAITTANVMTCTDTGGLSTPFLNATGTQSGTALGLKLSTNTGLSGNAGNISLFAGATNATDILLGAGHRMQSGSYYSWSSSATNAAVPDTSFFRSQAGEVQIGNSAIAGSQGGLKAAYFKVGGTTFTATGCGTATSLTGGATAGSFVAQATSCTIVITLGGASATNGWSVGKINDLTTNSDSNTWSQTATTATTVTLSGTAVIGDVINFSAMAY